MNFNKKRFDFFLIWGHGLQYKDEILKQLHNQPDFQIPTIYEHTAKNIKKIVRAVYDYDYAPFHLLRSKTKYLLKTPPEVLFIFAEDQNVKEAIYGSGKYLHVECQRIKTLKERLRRQFNPRNKNGSRSKHHVVHATDNELQTSKMVAYLGLGNDCRVFEGASKTLKNAPYHLGKIEALGIYRIETAHGEKQKIAFLYKAALLYRPARINGSVYQ